MTNPADSLNSFHEGCYIYIDSSKRTPNNDDFVITKIKGDNKVVFKQYKLDNDKLYLKPLNPDFSLELKPFKVLGKVVGKYIYTDL